VGTPLQKRAQAGAGGWVGTDNVISGCWFDSAADYMNRTWGTPTDAKKWIFGGWFRICGRTTLDKYLFCGGTSASGSTIYVGIDNNNNFVAFNGAGTIGYKSAREFRDVDWFNLIYCYDSTQATAADRVKLYINKIDQDENTITPPSLNQTFNMNTNAQTHTLGAYLTGPNGFWAGNMAQVFFIDGKSIVGGDIDIDDLADDSQVGVNGSACTPKRDSDIKTLIDAEGGNSFFLDFADSADLGNDASTNTNDWTENSMSSANHLAYDTPSDPRPVWSHAARHGQLAYNTTVEEGGVTTDHTTAQYGARMLSLGMPDTGKWYFECKVRNGDGIKSFGLEDLTKTYTGAPGTTTNSVCILNNGSAARVIRIDASDSNTRSADSTDDIFQMAFDADTREVWLGRNDTWYGTGSPEPDTGTDPLHTMDDVDETRYAIVCSVGASIDMQIMREEEWTYTVPTGYKDLRLSNLPAPVTQGADEFYADLFTGTGAENARTGYGFDVGASITKKTSAVGDWHLVDENRGATLNMEINNGNVESTDAQGVKTFDADGQTLGTDTDYNQSSATFISYGFHLSGAAGVSNSDGDITTTVDAQGNGCFSTAKFTGNGTANQDIGHGLGVKIASAWFLNRDAVGIVPVAWFPGLDAEYLNLAATNARAAGIFDGANSTTTIRVESNQNVNGSGEAMLALFFGQVPGVVQGGEYIGNGNADGPMIYTNFTPRWILVKSHNAGHEWIIWDTVREPHNENSTFLYLNSIGTQGTTAREIDILANGFKLRTSTGALNTSGNRFSFLAIADVGSGEDLPPLPGR
jgi:hypothetical protein